MPSKDRDEEVDEMTEDNSLTSDSRARRAPRKQSWRWMISTRAQSPKRDLARREEVPGGTADMVHHCFL